MPVERIEVHAFRVPTEREESDGRLAWDATTAVVVQAGAAGKVGLGWSYTHAAATRVVRDTLAPLVVGRDALDVPGAWEVMRRSLRNVGVRGIASSAMAAVDVALWDLKARLLDVALIRLLGRRREEVPVYGSGGFTSYTLEELREQMSGWVAEGMRMVKMKVGREPARDAERVEVVREAVGPDIEVFVDANGAYSRKQALGFARSFAEHGVTWFEEPVSSDDLDGLRLLRDRAPLGMHIAAGEYGWDLSHFRRLLVAGAVDVLQPDATRCGGFTGFLQAAELSDAHQTPVSSHTAPNLHAHVCAAAPRVAHLEYFHDHVRVEDLLFDGVLRPEDGVLSPDPSRPGMGLELKGTDVERFRV